MAVSKHTFRVSRPINQNFVAGLVLFCLPGIYTALTGLGAGGGRSSSGVVANQTNAILYGMFTLFACLGGTIVNILRPKLAMMVGSLGYPLYVGGLWYYDRTGITWFPLFAGAMLGTLCGILVTTCNMISFAYPEEHQKGLFICMQWMIRSVGASVGAAIALGCNIHQLRPVGVPTPVFVVFIVIQCSSLLLSAFLIIDPRDVIRDDGTHLALFKQPTLKAELTAFAKCFLDKRLIIMFPAIFSCEMALALVSTINGFYFNLRTRCLNNFLFQVIQFFGPGILIWILDTKAIPNRKHRGLLAAGIMGLVAVGACIGCFIWLHAVNWTSIKKAPGNDFTSSNYGGFVVVYLMFGLIYSGYQMVVEWIVSSMSNDPSLVAQYAGFMRGWASFGMCISFVMAAQKVPQWGQATFQIILYVLGTLGQAWVLIYYIRPTDYFHEENTIAPHYAEDKAITQDVITEEQLDNEHRKDEIAAAGGNIPAISTIDPAKDGKADITSVGKEL